LPKSRIYDSIDLPQVSELDGLFIFLNTRRNTVVPILQELPTPEQAAGYFMLGESIETAAGDPTKIGQSLRVVGTNPFIVGPEGEEGNMFYEFVKKFEDKVRCFVMNTGGVGELMDPEQPGKVIKEPSRPWKSGIGYVTRAVFRNTARWFDSSDYGTRVLIGGVTDHRGEHYDIDRFDPRQVYDSEEMLNDMVIALNKERIKYLEGFPTLDEQIISAMKSSLRTK
jgi:phosphoenolpyruvate carboxykinase (ATP)